jgi:hypothetical protein
MPRLLKKPLTWMVIGECVVVVALIVVAWNVVAAATQGSGSAAAAQPSLTIGGAPAAPSPAMPSVARQAAHGQLPGLNLDSAFWRSRLGQLNRDQVFFEQLEWRIIHSAMDAANRYLETVVLPSLTRAERGVGH